MTSFESFVKDLKQEAELLNKIEASTNINYGAYCEERLMPGGQGKIEASVCNLPEESNFLRDWSRAVSSCKIGGDTNWRCATPKRKAVLQKKDDGLWHVTLM